MEAIYENHRKIILGLKSEFERELADNIDWTDRMIAIKGSRGVGKTTMILQHIKKQFGVSESALLISMDDIMLADYSIYEIAEYHSIHGGTHLFVDEIHKYADWSIELKNVYDKLPELSLVFSSSSILQIYQGYADLSRRVVAYDLHGLSLREFIQIETKQSFKKLSLKEVLKDHEAIATEIMSQIKPLAYMKAYLQHGYFPFYLQSKKSYYAKLNNVLNTILNVDLPHVLGVNIQNVAKLKRLIKIIGSAMPFQPNMSKLAESVGIERKTLSLYLNYLEQAEIISMVTVIEKSYSQLLKPEKIFLQNTNFCHALNAETNKGTMRELFFLNQLKQEYQVNHAQKGDFLVEEKYVFEIGGPKKTFDQIAGIENSYLALDELEIGHKNKIPLWIFGFIN